MGYFPVNARHPLPVIAPTSHEALGNHIRVIGGSAAPAPATWPTAKKVFYIPFVVEESTTFNSTWLLNGSIASGNFDIGVYNRDGVRLFSTGSTAQVGTTTVQNASISAVTLGPGSYYLALSMDNTTSNPYRTVPTIAQVVKWGMMEETTVSFGLPATATMIRIATAYLPFFGLSTIGAV